MSQPGSGYYRYPTIYQDKIIFIAEDDMWQVDAEGGVARRLSANLGAVSTPLFSPDGQWVAFVGQDEGHPEVYVMPATGGPARRLTFNGSTNVVVAWHDRKIIFASNSGQPFLGQFVLYQIDVAGGDAEPVPIGPARAISYGPKGVVIGRNVGDPARWKRYRGGRAGVLWIDREGDGNFEKFLQLDGNLAAPMWIDARIYFVSDHEGIANLYSCRPDESDLQKHTDHTDFFVRNATTDGKRIVYHCGADIYVFDLQTGKSKVVAIEYHSPHVQRNRKFVDAARYLESYRLSFDGSRLALTSRGKSFTMGNWEGAVVQNGVRNGVRYKLTSWLKDGQHVVTASDRSGESRLEVHPVSLDEPVRSFDDLDIGIPYDLKVSPVNDEVILVNHRHELLHIDVQRNTMTQVEQSEYGPIQGFDWSADGRWVAYAFSPNRTQSVIKIYGVGTGQIEQVTEPMLTDYKPVFDPEGKYLYFLSDRILNPVYDRVYFDLNFPRATRPYLITLQKETRSPFVPEPKGFEYDNHKNGAKRDKNDQEELKPIHIDFEGIQNRVVPFPVDEDVYIDIAAVKNKVFYTTYPVEGALNRNIFSNVPSTKSTLKMYDLKDLEESTFLANISSFELSADGMAIACRIGNKLRVLKTQFNPKESPSADSKPGRKSGWIDLSRLKVSIDPIPEWQQMFREVWRLQREFFWDENMSKVDWEKVYERYFPLIERVGTRGELSDLIWELQGELGTSHAYEIGGDYRPTPRYKIGFLGANVSFDAKQDAYRIDEIVSGDPWDDRNSPPLLRPGLNIEVGMFITAVNGIPVDADTSPNQLLVNQVDQEVQLTITDASGQEGRDVTVKTVATETPLRYRDWVEENRRYVHDQSEGKIGYVHIPNMGPLGYSEFHRYFLPETEYDGVIVDVRFNGGGHVSSLLLEKLARKRTGYYKTRWMGVRPKPGESVAGPIVALTNENAGSDGDIFSHLFKLMKLGKLIGKRTWGGVVGIWPRNWLADGSVVTQPEFSNWFVDVGWGVENYGTDPDIEVDIAPQDYARNQDPQLDKAIEVALEELKQNPPLKPDMSQLPDLTLPD